MARRFAEDTRVPINQTVGEIKDRLKRSGAGQIAVFESEAKSAVAFQVGFGMYRITVPIDPKASNRAQEERRAWRLLGLLIKSKLEAVREGATTIEREFMADMLMHNGQTMSEWAVPQIEAAHREGRMPETLMLERPR